MAGDMTTQLDKPYAQQPATREAAARYLERSGNADLLPILDLADEPEDQAQVINGRRLCPNCRNPLPDPISNGGNKPCRRRSCIATGA